MLPAHKEARTRSVSTKVQKNVEKMRLNSHCFSAEKAIGKRWLGLPECYLQNVPTSKFAEANKAFLMHNIFFSKLPTSWPL